MSLISALAATAAVAAGTAGAVTAYQLASPEPASAPAIETVEQGTGADRPRFAPCQKPARLEGGRCVANLTRTVVVPGATIAGSPALPTAPARNDQTPDFGDDARRDLDDDELVTVEDDDFDDDDDGTHTQTRTRSHADTGTHTSTGSSTSTRTRTGGSGTSG